MKFTVLDPATRQVLYTGDAADLAPILAMHPVVVAGVKHTADWLDDAGFPQVVPQPPSPRHTWNWIEKSWVDPGSDVPALARTARADRNRRLVAADVAVLRALERGVAVAQAWLDYREALRELPAQPGFPQTIDWPEAPPS
jgi:hypothetical protein